MAIAPVPELVAELAAGRMVILVDEEDRENEGDLVLAADHVTPEAINFMAALRPRPDLPDADARALRAPAAAADGGAQRHPARHRLHRLDRGRQRRHHRHLRRRPRAHRAGRGGDATRSASDLVQPGHIFPLQAQDGGVLMRAGHTEAGCDLAAMAGLDAGRGDLRGHEGRRHDGAPARPRSPSPSEHGLKIGTIADLIEHRSRNESLIERVGTRKLLDAAGRVRLHRLHATAPAACTWR